MTAQQPDVAAGPSSDVVEIERALARIAHLISRAKQHGHVTAEAGVVVERAAVPVLRLLADCGPQRPGALAAQLAVEAPHVTRQLQRLQRQGYVASLPDPDDGRAHLVRLTPAGEEAERRVRQVRQQWMADALADWPREDLRRLATLFHRMVDDFLAHSERRCGS